MIMDMIKDLLS